MKTVASKWSKSLKTLVINSTSSYLCANSECLMLLTDLHEMQTFHLNCWRMESMDDDVRHLVMSWPKLRILRLPLDESFIYLSTLRIIVLNCVICIFDWILLQSHLSIPPAKAFAIIWRFWPWGEFTHLLKQRRNFKSKWHDI